MIALKYIYIVIIVLYIGVIAAWCMRYPLSYRTVGVKPDLIEERSLTHQEYKALERAVKIRQWCSKMLLYASLLVFVTSIFFLRNQWFEPVTIVKVIMIAAGIIALLLIIVNGIHFIPGPPIR
jgi:hypothetical protein